VDPIPQAEGYKFSVLRSERWGKLRLLQRGLTDCVDAAERGLAVWLLQRGG
jgi:hypothetical protein